MRVFGFGSGWFKSNFVLCEATLVWSDQLNIQVAMQYSGALNVILSHVFVKLCQIENPL